MQILRPEGEHIGRLRKAERQYAVRGLGLAAIGTGDAANLGEGELAGLSGLYPGLGRKYVDARLPAKKQGSEDPACNRNPNLAQDHRACCEEDEKCARRPQPEREVARALPLHHDGVFGHSAEIACLVGLKHLDCPWRREEDERDAANQEEGGREIARDRRAGVFHQLYSCPAAKQAQGWVGGQDVMAELGQKEFKEKPGGESPGHDEFQRVTVYVAKGFQRAMAQIAPAEDESGNQEEDTREEPGGKVHEVIARQAAMTFRRRDQLVLQVLADGAFDISALRRDLDRNQPWQDHEHTDQRPRPPGKRFHPLMVAPVPKPENEDRHTRDKRDDGAFDEEACPMDDPEGERQALVIILPEIEPDEATHRQRDQENENAVRL